MSHQVHKAGKKLYVDYCGMTLVVHAPMTQQKVTAEIFVAALGASNYTFAETTPGQSLAHWIGSHQRAMAFFGGVPDEATVSSLIKLLSHEDAFVRRGSAYALGQGRVAAAIPGLMQQLQENDPWVPGNAAIALGKIKDPVAVPMLIQTRSAQKKEWEPLKIFRAVSTKAKKINFDSIPATKKKELTKAIQRVQELGEEIDSIS